MNYEAEANKYNISIIKITFLTILISFILNELGIFIISPRLARIGCISSLCILLIGLIVLRIVNLEKPFVKYFILATEILTIFIIGIFLTYHITFCMAVPFFMAAHYHEKKLSLYIYFISCIYIIAALLLGYQYGICDMNMVAFTSDTITSYGPNNSIASFPIQYINADVIFKLLTYFAIPRIGMCFIFYRMSVSLAESGLKEDLLKQAATYEGEHDTMTGVYNKNKYINTIAKLRNSHNTVGIMYFDINNLKYINDNFSHELGDKLICIGAKSLRYAITDDMEVYRIGGDEFVILIPNCDEADIKSTLTKWQNALRLLNDKEPELQCIMAVGCAVGKGKHINTLIKKADKQMYENKRDLKAKAAAIAKNSSNEAEAKEKTYAYSLEQASTIKILK